MTHIFWWKKNHHTTVYSTQFLPTATCLPDPVHRVTSRSETPQTNASECRRSGFTDEWFANFHTRWPALSLFICLNPYSTIILPHLALTKTVVKTLHNFDEIMANSKNNRLTSSRVSLQFMPRNGNSAICFSTRCVKSWWGHVMIFQYL